MILSAAASETCRQSALHGLKVRFAIQISSLPTNLVMFYQLPIVLFWIGVLHAILSCVSRCSNLHSIRQFLNISPARLHLFPIGACPCAVFIRKVCALIRIFTYPLILNQLSRFRFCTAQHMSPCHGMMRFAVPPQPTNL